jgi:ferritin-like metal-binding protein YciE
VRTFANLLGDREAALLLQQTLDDEKETDQQLSELAEDINIEAEQGSEETGAGENEERVPSRASSRKKPAA